jgi:hypothetical protein
MSAFIVSKTQINALVRFASTNGVIFFYGPTSQRWNVSGNEDATAQLLLDENVRSVNFRYKEEGEAGQIVYQLDAPELTAVQVIKLAQCLEYQSCETPDWEGTMAKKFLDAITSLAITKLPGYEEAPWTIEPGQLPKGPISLLDVARKSGRLQVVRVGDKS